MFSSDEKNNKITPNSFSLQSGFSEREQDSGGCEVTGVVPNTAGCVFMLSPLQARKW